MNADDFAYHLPEELIAAHPAPSRAESRLMVLPADSTAAPLHHRFSEIRSFLKPGDLLVVNNTRVIPARLYLRRQTGGEVEILLLHRLSEEGSTERWEAMLRPAKKVQPGEVITDPSGLLSASVTAIDPSGTREITLAATRGTVGEALSAIGRMPIPPYILKARQRAGETADSIEDAERYQTVYAQQTGSVAAPTAGLHFSRELLETLRNDGVGFAEVTLHVGAGTFVGMEPGSQIQDHRMHSEEYEVTAAAAEAINRARVEGRRIVAVGTTTVRTLESAVSAETGLIQAGRSATQLMITPGFHFRAVDSLVTNFHLPRSTLLLLVSAFVGRERLLAAYAEAIGHRYRFYSYGDAMMVNKSPGSM